MEQAEGAHVCIGHENKKKTSQKQDTLTRAFNQTKCIFSYSPGFPNRPKRGILYLQNPCIATLGYIQGHLRWFQTNFGNSNHSAGKDFELSARTMRRGGTQRQLFVMDGSSLPLVCDLCTTSTYKYLLFIVHRRI